MPPRNLNQQAPMEPGEEPLPVMDNGIDWDQLNAMNGVNMTEEDMLASGMAPDDVVNDVVAEPEVRRAEPNMQATGAFMNLDFINQINNAATDEEAKAMYDALDPALKRVYDRSFGMQISPQWAAQVAQSYYDEQDRIAAQQAAKQNDPKAAAAMQAEMSAARSALETADNIVNIMDRLRGFRKGAEGTESKTPKYFGRVGPIDSLAPQGLSGDRNAWFIDFKALQDQLALAARGALRGTGPISNFEQEMLRNAAMGGLDYGRDDASFAQVFEQTYDIAKRKREEQKAALEAMQKGTAPAAAQPSTTSQPAAAASAGTQTRRVGNQIWERTPNGWMPQR